MERALKAEGRDPAEADKILMQPGDSRQGHLVSELAGYDAAKHIYERLVNSGRKDLEEELATLCILKALVHMTADDSPGAFSEYDRAIDIYERLVNKEDRRELSSSLAKAYISKACKMWILGDNNAALELQSHAIEIYEHLVNQEGRSEEAYMLAGLYMNKANGMLVHCIF